MTNSFVTNVVLIERAVSCWPSASANLADTQYLDSWLADLLQSEQNELLEVKGAHAPEPHSWRRHCSAVGMFDAIFYTNFINIQ